MRVSRDEVIKTTMKIGKVAAPAAANPDFFSGAFGMVDLLLRRLAGEETESLVMQPELMVRQSA